MAGVRAIRLWIHRIGHRGEFSESHSNTQTWSFIVRQQTLWNCRSLLLAVLSLLLLMGPIHCRRAINVEVGTGQNGEPLPTDLPVFVARIPLEVQDYVLDKRGSMLGAEPIDAGTKMRLSRISVERQSITTGHTDVITMVILDGPHAGMHVNAKSDLVNGPFFTPDLRPIAKKHILPRFNPLQQSKESK